MDNTELAKMEELIKEAFAETTNYYRSVFKEYIPTYIDNKYNASGFTERNITFNFCRFYLGKSNTQCNDIIVWQEVPLRKGNNTYGNMDSLIIDKARKSIIFIEAKRVYGINHYEELRKDFSRIRTDFMNIPNFNQYKDYDKYGLALADIRLVLNPREMDNYKNKIEIYCGHKYEEIEFEKTKGRNFRYYLNYKFEKI